MLKYCGYSYAMENAPQNVKEAAKHVCPSNEEDGRTFSVNLNTENPDPETSVFVILQMEYDCNAGIFLFVLI